MENTYNNKAILQKQKTGSVLLIIGSIILFISIIGFIVILSGSSSNNSYLSNLKNQIDSNKAKVATIDSKLSQYTDTSKLDNNQIYTYNSLVNERSYLVNTINSQVQAYNSALNNYNDWENYSSIIDLLFFFLGAMFFLIGISNKTAAKKMLAAQQSVDNNKFINYVNPATEDIHKPVEPVQTTVPRPVTPRPVVEEAPVKEDPRVKEVIHDDDYSAKLKKIKSLYDEGLISEEDYNKKKSEILDKI